MLIFIFFFLILLLIVLGSHLLIGLFIIKFFLITGGFYKNLVYAGLSALALSFVASVIIIHWWQGPVLKIAYGLSSIWLGLALNLILASIIGWLIILVSRLAGWNLNHIWASALLLAFALSFSIYGIWNANQIKVKTINIGIPNLPKTWVGRTAVQISDTHLGAINGAAFFKKIVALAKKENPDVIFITGDLFDGSSKDFKNLIEPLKELRTPMGMYFITGNHEVYSGLGKVEAALSLIPVRTLNDEVINIEGVQIAGIYYPSENIGTKKDVQPILEKIDKSKPSIVLYHEPVPGIVEKIKKAGVNLLLTGHTHRGQIFPANFFSWLIYRDYFYGVYKDGPFTLYTTSGAGTWGPPMRNTGAPEIVKIIFR